MGKIVAEGANVTLARVDEEGFCEVPW